MKNHVVIEDLSSPDCYTVLCEEEFLTKNPQPKTFFKGTLQKCMNWIAENPHPNSVDFTAYYDGDNSFSDEEFE
jgi:hypothetical protein